MSAPIAFGLTRNQLTVAENAAELNRHNDRILKARKERLYEALSFVVAFDVLLVAVLILL